MFNSGKEKILLGIINTLTEQIKSLQEQNKDLHDRLIARSAEEYWYNKSLSHGIIESQKQYDEIQKDNLVGEVIEDENS